MGLGGVGVGAWELGLVAGAKVLIRVAFGSRSGARVGLELGLVTGAKVLVGVGWG